MKKELLASLLFLMGTCLYAQKTVEYHFQDTQARALDATANAYVKPMTVELEILPDAKRVFSVTLTKSKVENDLRGDLSNIRSYVTFLYSDEAHADIILTPVFNIETNDAGGYIVTVKGFPAIYKNWKTATQADYEWIRLVQVDDTTDKEKTKTISK